MKFHFHASHLHIALYFIPHFFFCLSFSVDWTLRKITTTMSTAPKLEDLPKVADDFKSELEHFSTDKLKDTVTHEKIVLPTAEGMFTHFVFIKYAAFTRNKLISASVKPSTVTSRTMRIYLYVCGMVENANMQIRQSPNFDSYLGSHWKSTATFLPLKKIFVLIYSGRPESLCVWAAREHCFSVLLCSLDLMHE